MNDRLKKLEDLLQTLRGPDGCPWDREQTLPDLRAYVLEEAHELAAAIDSEERLEIREELGDLLFQLVFVASLIESPDDGSELDQAIEGIHQKMVDRHPHVFGGEKLADSGTVRRAWEERKSDRAGSALAGVPQTLPALLAAYRISQKAAGVGFDWPDVGSVLTKVTEELTEVGSAVSEGLGTEDIQEEVGDLLFATANLARKLGFDPEATLHRANAKFKRRFEKMEEALGDGERMSGRTADELEALWQLAKKQEG